MKIGDRISICLIDRKERTLGDLIPYLAKHIDPKFSARKFSRKTSTDKIPLEEQVSIGKFLMICEGLRGAENRGDVITSRKKEEPWTYETLVQITDQGYEKCLAPMRSRQGNMLVGEMSRLLYIGAISVDLDLTKMGGV